MANPDIYVFNNRSYVDLYPIQFGREACQPCHSFGPTMKYHYLFHYIVSGKGKLFLTTDQREIELTAGQGFLIPPNLIASYEADKDDPWSYIWVEFDGLKTEHFLRQAGLSKKQLVFSQKLAATKSPVYEALLALLERHDSTSAAIVGHLYLFMTALMAESLTHRDSIHDDAKELYVREAINFIERHFQEPITVDDMAHQCNLNRSYFSRLFKEQMSTTPQQFLIQYRLSQACELLKNSQLTLQEIAEQVGYSNQFNFSAAFKRQYKEAPNNLRKHYR